jgi:aldose 1-epimerase
MKMKKEALTTDFRGSVVCYDMITLECEDGFSVSLCSIGASIRQIKTPAFNGVFQNIALSLADDRAYLGNPLYAGATLAPCAGRISNGRLMVDGRPFPLSRNENDRHTLHGGFDNASFRVWTVEDLQQSAHMAQVTFSCLLPDGLDGFPGNREIKAVYTLTDATHTLTVQYLATSDQATYFNLSNHTYFNLTGDFSQPAYDHQLRINADRYLCNAPDFIPEGIAAVDDSPFDFRQARSLRQQFEAYPHDLQLGRNQGYNHGFVLKRGADKADIEHGCGAASSGALPDCDHLAADLIYTAPGSPVRLEISSDAPCMVLYSGGYIPDDLSLANGQTSCPGCGLAFEFQDFPDAPGGHDFLPYYTTPAGTCWSRTIQYKFRQEG